MNIFCERLKKLRIEHNLSINELSKIIGITPSTLRRWENKGVIVNCRYIPSIVNYFNVSLDYLVGLSDDKNPLF